MSQCKKILPLQLLLPLVEAQKKAGKTVVFTNGCFDLLHVGHLRSLEHAASLGDLLIVGINDDISVSALKGKNRPLFPENERAELIAGFECVDYVTIFSGNTVADVLRTLKPHIHAKGTDYTEQNVPEREVVLSYGGKIAITGDPKNHSSSEIIDKMESAVHRQKK